MAVACSSLMALHPCHGNLKLPHGRVDVTSVELYNLKRSLPNADGIHLFLPPPKTAAVLSSKLLIPCCVVGSWGAVSLGFCCRADCRDSPLNTTDSSFPFDWVPLLQGDAMLAAAHRWGRIGILPSPTPSHKGGEDILHLKL